MNPRSKYRAVRVVDAVLGSFDSKREYTRWCELQVLEAAGVISDLRRQVRYRLDVNGVHVCDYVADAVYAEGLEQVVEDTKGVRTAVYRIKAKLMLAVHGIKIRETE